MHADDIEADFSGVEPNTPDKRLIALYIKHLGDIYINRIRDKQGDRQYDEVFNLIDKLREFFAWIYYFSKEQKLKEIDTTDLTELNKYTYINDFDLVNYSDEHVEATKNVYIIMEQFAIRDHLLFHLDEHFFHKLLDTNDPCGNDHNYPTHLIFLKHLCSKRVNEDEILNVMVKAYPHAVWMDYPLFFPDGNARLTDAEIILYETLVAADLQATATGGSRSVSKHKKVSKSNRITHKKRK